MYVYSTQLKSLLLVVLCLSVIAPMPSFGQDTNDEAAAEDDLIEETVDDDDLFGGDEDDFDLFGGPEEEDTGLETDEEAGPRFRVPDDVETIQITGQKTDASNQGASIAITSFNQEALDQLGVSNVQSLQQNVPSLHIGQTGTQGIITLRGVGIENLTISGEPGVLFVQDGVPIGNATAALSAFYDVRSLDVLRGPQGTQGGRHVSGGWIGVTSAPPTPDFAAFGDYQIGSYNQHIFRGVLNAPIFDEKLMFRFTSRFEDRDGYQRAIGTKFNGYFPAQNVEFKQNEWWGNEHSLTARAQLLSQVTDRLEIHLIGMHSFSKNNGPAIHLLSDPGTFTEASCQVNLNCIKNVTPRYATSSRDPRRTTRDSPGSLVIGQWFTTAKATYDITSATLGELEAVAQFGFNRTNTKVGFDFDETDAHAAVIQLGCDPARRANEPAPAASHPCGPNRSDQYTLEVKLRTVEQRPWQWQAGFFWWQETKFADQAIDLAGNNPNNDGITINKLETDSLAGFAEISYWLTEEFRFLFGARYMADHKAVKSQSYDFQDTGLIVEDAQVEGNGTWSAFTPKALVFWQWADSNNVSFNVTGGFKAGGFALGAKCDSSEGCESYNPEQVWQYEFTSKNDFFDERLRLNLTLFWTDYDPYQVCYVAGTAFRCFDSGSATTRGVEVEWSAFPIPELMIQGNFNILDARIDNFRIVDPTERNPFPGTNIENPLSGEPQDISGNAIPKSPKYNFTVNVQYDIHADAIGLPEDWGTLTPRVQYNFQSKTFYRVWNQKSTSQGAYSKVDLRLTWRSNSNRWQIESFVNNLTDVDVINSIFLGSGFDGSITAQYQPPRMAGIRLKFSY